MQKIDIKNTLNPILRKKYLLATVLFFIWLILFDQNSLLKRQDSIKHLETLKDKKVYYLQKIESESKQLYELKTNKQNLEKYAREQYLMRKSNEDVFLIIEE